MDWIVTLFLGLWTPNKLPTLLLICWRLLDSCQWNLVWSLLVSLKMWFWEHHLRNDPMIQNYFPLFLVSCGLPSCLRHPGMVQDPILLNVLPYQAAHWTIDETGEIFLKSSSTAGPRGRAQNDVLLTCTQGLGPLAPPFIIIKSLLMWQQARIKTKWDKVRGH